MPCPHGCICAICRHTVHSLLVQQAEYDYEWHRGITSLLGLLMREAPQVINTKLQNSQRGDAVLHAATRAGAAAFLCNKLFLSRVHHVFASNTTESKWT